MKTLLGAFVGLLLWAFLFLVLPGKFLGLVVGRPFELDDGQFIVRDAWGMLLMIAGFFVLPVVAARIFRESK
jgi:hypothetical protein